MINFFARLFKKSRDPIEILPTKAMEIILEQLSGTELLKLSLVSKKWFAFIGKSARCMDKIKIHITEYFWSEKRIFTNVDLLRVLKSGRKYKHLSFAYINSKIDQFSPEHKLLMAHFQWKSISICNHSFENELEFINFLGLFEPFVEEIELRSVKIRKLLNVASHNFLFPHLKILRLINVSNFAFIEAFSNVEDLHEFAVATQNFLPTYKDHSEKVRERAEGVKLILLKNSSVKVLELFLEQKDFDYMFFDSGFVDRIGFNLKMLMLGGFQKLPKDYANFFPMKNFARFLRSQASSLNQLYMPACLGDEILEITFNETKNLKFLTIHQTDDESNPDLSYSKVNLHMNDKIERLDIWIRSVKMTEVVIKVLPSLPNLKQLTTRIVDQTILNIMANMNPHLEVIESDFFTASAPPPSHALTKLIRVNISINSNDSFRQLLERKEELSTFERVFLKSAKTLKRKWDLHSQSFNGLESEHYSC